MFQLELLGFDTLQIQPKIKLPDIFELAQQRMFINASMEDAHRYSSPMMRRIFDQIPIVGGYKHIMITSIVQFLTPNTSSIQNAKWHIDPGFEGAWRHDAKLHILATGENLTSTTKFLDKGITVDMPDELINARPRVLREYLTEREGELGFIETPVPQDCFVTFTNRHLHIALPPYKNELRYFLRVQESNIEAPRKWDEAKKDSTSTLLNDGTERMFTSFIQKENGFEVRYR